VKIKKRKITAEVAEDAEKSKAKNVDRMTGWSG
jgi:hypothetical protein